MFDNTLEGKVKTLSTPFTKQRILNTSIMKIVQYNLGRFYFLFKISLLNLAVDLDMIISVLHYRT